jgi:hypothetical protein
MYAYVAARAGQNNEFYEGAEFDETTRDFVNKTVTKPREIAYWRKHPNLHGWMEQLWQKKNPEDVSSFNGIELELTALDLDELEQVLLDGRLPHTQGFFFGNTADNHYLDNDLAFVQSARAELFLGLRVFYNSSW